MHGDVYDHVAPRCVNIYLLEAEMWLIAISLMLA